MSNYIKLIIAFLFITTGVILRLIDHLPNFTPIAAIALFGAVYLPRRLAFIIPIAAMLISDIFIGFYAPSLMAVVYGSFLLTVILGLWLEQHKNWPNILASSLGAAVLFFITTNLAVWALTPWYAKTLTGLIQCYYLALPFFRNGLMGDLFYTVAFFGLYQAVGYLVKSKLIMAILRRPIG